MDHIATLIVHFDNRTINRMEQLTLCQLYRLGNSLDRETVGKLFDHYGIPSNIIELIRNI